VTRARRIITGNHVHQAVEGSRRHALARCGQIHAIAPSIGYGVINLHQVQDGAGSTAWHIDVIAYNRCSSRRVWYRDRSLGSPSHTIKALVGRRVATVKARNRIQVWADRRRRRGAPSIIHGRFIHPRRGCAGRRGGSGAVSAATIEKDAGARPPAPDNHLAVSVSPHCFVRASGSGRISRAGWCPTVGAGVVSPTGVQIAAAVVSAPDNHFSASPH
jgi:hypothetical protein